MERKKLIDAVKQFNAKGLAEKNIDPKLSTAKLTKVFIEAVKIIPDEREKEIPDDVIDVYNNLTKSLEDHLTKIKIKKEKKEMKKVETKKEVKKEKLDALIDFLKGKTKPEEPLQ